MHPKLNVYSIHDRPTELREIGVTDRWCAGAAVSFPVIAARAGIGRRHKHERRRVFNLCLEAGNAHLPVLQRPAKCLQDGLWCLAEFIKKEDAPRGQRHFPGEDVVSAAAAKERRL